MYLLIIQDAIPSTNKKNKVPPMQLASTLGLQIDKLSMLLSPDLIVDQACDPTLLEPNLSLNLEICDLINLLLRKVALKKLIFKKIFGKRNLMPKD